MFAKLKAQVLRVVHLVDAHATKLLGLATGALAGADVSGVADPLRELIGSRGFDVLLLTIAAATYARGHVTGLRARRLEARVSALEQSGSASDGRAAA